MLKIVGVQRKTGKYEGYDYDNINLHCVEDNPTSDSVICGSICVKPIKIKVQTVREVFDGLVTGDDDWKALLGARIRVYCDTYGKVQRVEVVEDDADKVPY